MARTSERDPVPEKLKVRPLTLYGVEGHQLRCNDVVFQPALPSSAASRALALQRTLVFFGGDIQNFSYLMDHDDKVIDYRKWCLETTALRLSAQFPACHIVVVKPSRVVFDHISCYDNFVESNHLGIPKYYYQYMALRHLDLLLQTLSRTIRQMDPDVLFKMLLQTLDEEEHQEKHNLENGSVRQYENMPRKRKRVLRTWQKTLNLDMQPMRLVAFSKGCVVLNQFLYEFHYARSLATLHSDSCIIERIREMYWLDSGNCGRQNVYVTSTGILRTLTELDIIIHVHGSMYMTEDENRPWITKQFNEFIAGIKAENGNVLHFRHVSPTDDIVSHFEVLMQFKYSEKKHLRSINSPRVRRQRKPQPEQEPPAPAAPAPEPARAGLRRKRPSHNESIGLCLVNLHDSPYLGLQISVQKHALPIKATEARLSCPNLGQIVYPKRRKILSTGLTRADIPMLTQMPISAQTTSAPSANSAEPSMSAQTPSPPVQSTSAQKPPASRVAWSSGQLPSHKDYTAMLLNEICYSFSEEEALASKNSPYYNLHAPVIALPNHRNSLRMHVYAPEKEIYVPKMYSHHYVVNRMNENDGGEQLPSFFPEEGAPPAADDLEPAASGRAYNAGSSDPDPELEVARLTASSNFTAARSGIATGPVDAISSSDDSSDSSDSNPGSDSDVQAPGPNPNISDSDSDGSVAGPDPNESEHSSGSGTSSPVDRGVGSQAASRAGVQSIPRGSQMASSSQDSIAPRAGTSGARVRARDIDDEPLHRYNLRKRIRRSYDESIFHPEYE